MLTLEKRYGGPQGIQVKFLFHMPRILTEDGRWERPVQNAIIIHLTLSIVPGMKAIIRLPAILDYYISGQEAVQAPFKDLWGVSRVDQEMSHLIEGVHPGIGTPSPDDRNGLSGHCVQSRFNGSLHGGHALLTLPAMIGSAIVLNNQLEISRQGMHRYRKT